MTEYKHGDKINVKIGDRTFETIIDKRGVQRFKENTVISAFYKASTEAYNDWMRTGREGSAPFNLNTLAKEYHAGKHTLDDMLTFYTSFGYSVDGFADVSFFEGLEIRNPVWEAGHFKSLSSRALQELMGLANIPFRHNGDESVRFFFEVVRYGKWGVKDGDYVALSDTIDRVLIPYLRSKGFEPWDIKPTDETSDEVKSILTKWA